MKGINDFYEMKCAVCGKNICMASPNEWAYKIIAGTKSTRKYCCSWHCFRAIERNKGVGNKSGKKNDIFAMLAAGMKDNEIAERAGVTIGTVRYWKERYTGGYQNVRET